VRYCISANDARTNNSAVTLFTAPSTTWNGLKLYNNTVYVTPSSKNTYTTFGAFQMTDYGTNMSGVECYNNIFYTTGGLPLLNVPSTFTAQTPKFIGNLYFADGQALSFKYGSSYNSMSSFRGAGAYCEKNGSDTTGMVLNPNLLNINSLTVFPKPTDSLKSFMTSLISPCRNKGLDLKTKFGIDMGTRDYWGNTLKNENAYDIGANEWSNKSSAIHAIEFSEISVYPNPIGKDNLVIDMPINLSTEIHMQLIDMTGKVCMEQTLHTGSNSIQTHALPQGIYTIVVSDSFRSESFKLVKVE
jgi:hypothetical protein